MGVIFIKNINNIGREEKREITKSVKDGRSVDGKTDIDGVEVNRGRDEVVDNVFHAS